MLHKNSGSFQKRKQGLKCEKGHSEGGNEELKLVIHPLRFRQLGM